MNGHAPAPGDYSDAALDRLTFRRQFILGTELPETRPGWRRVAIDPRRRADVHPDLEVCQATSGRAVMTLLGYALDPHDPAATNAVILLRLVDRLDRCHDILGLTTDLGGRWALAVHDGERTILINDASGLRQVYYTTGGPAGEVVCASRPGLIAEFLGLSRDPAAVAYIRSRGLDDGEVYWLPGDTSIYAGVRVLLPNHLLDLGSGQATRFWPSADLLPVPRDEARAETVRLMQGQMDSARRRWPLAIAMTAGWDSRLTLALCRDAAPDLYAFTLLHPGGSDRSRDVAIPSALLPTLGITHHVIRYPTAVHAALKAVHTRNSESANDAYGADGQALYEAYPVDRVCVTGDVAEVVKCHFRKPVSAAGAVTARDLAALCGQAPHPFLLAAFDRWLAGAEPRNLHLLDLFCWEQMGGRWQAHIRADFDIVHESFAPLNCRRLLETMLGVDEDDRRGPEFRFLWAVIERTWHEVLSVPINPPEPVSPGEVVGRTLRRFRVRRLIPSWAIALGKRLVRH
jgi:hypothetical protein